MTTRVYVEFDNEHAASNFLRDIALQATSAYLTIKAITDSGYLED